MQVTERSIDRSTVSCGNRYIRVHTLARVIAKVDVEQAGRAVESVSWSYNVLTDDLLFSGSQLFRMSVTIAPMLQRVIRTIFARKDIKI
jgi:uncharacterized membrane protein YgdD (TMEM256/DUF423 family)